VIDVGARQSALKTERETLQSARVLAMIDGGEFDSRRLAEIDTELAALDDVSVVIARRASQQAKDDAERRRTAAVAVVQGREIERGVELVRAQQHATGLAEAILRFKELTDQQITALDEFDLNAPLSLLPAQVDRRLSHLVIATVLSTLSRTGAFGNIEWTAAPPDALGAWPDYEKTACASALESTINPQGNSDDDATTSDDATKQ